MGDRRGFFRLIGLLVLAMLLQPLMTGLFALLFGLKIPIAGTRDPLTKVFTDYAQISILTEIWLWPRTWGVVLILALFFRTPARFAAAAGLYELLFFLYYYQNAATREGGTFFGAHAAVLAFAMLFWFYLERRRRVAASPMDSGSL